MKKRSNVAAAAASTLSPDDAPLLLVMHPPVPPAEESQPRRKRVAKAVAAVATAAEVAAAAASAARAAVDFSQPAERVKKLLSALFPVATKDAFRVATPAEAEHAERYLRARDAASIAEGEKEHAANRLRFAIGEGETIKGEGWVATWKNETGNVDWSALAKELAIPEATIARFRKPSHRVLRVTEKDE